jgi:hypothetical protein
MTLRDGALPGGRRENRVSNKLDDAWLVGQGWEGEERQAHPTSLSRSRHHGIARLPPAVERPCGLSGA